MTTFNMTFKRIVVFTALAALLVGAGCSSRTKTGAVIGTAGGAAVGAAIGNAAGNTALGAILGAAVGGAAGAYIGNYMDKQAAELEAVLSEQDRLRREQESSYLSLGSDVLFESVSAAVQAGGRNKLLEVAGILSRYPRTVITVTGHTDSRGA